MQLDPNCPTDHELSRPPLPIPKTVESRNVDIDVCRVSGNTSQDPLPKETQETVFEPEISPNMEQQLFPDWFLNDVQGMGYDNGDDEEESSNDEEAGKAMRADDEEDEEDAEEAEEEEEEDDDQEKAPAATAKTPKPTGSATSSVRDAKTKKKGKGKVRKRPANEALPPTADVTLESGVPVMIDSLGRKVYGTIAAQASNDGFKMAKFPGIAEAVEIPGELFSVAAAAAAAANEDEEDEEDAEEAEEEEEEDDDQEKAPAATAKTPKPTGSATSSVRERPAAASKKKSAAESKMVKETKKGKKKGKKKKRCREQEGEKDKKKTAAETAKTKKKGKGKVRKRPAAATSQKKKKKAVRTPTAAEDGNNGGDEAKTGGAETGPEQRDGEPKQKLRPLQFYLRTRPAGQSLEDRHANWRSMTPRTKRHFTESTKAERGMDAAVD